ncbi:hypothetical protein P9X10_02565 [Bacillus cereus]|nr:hypothetical protein [Bacillus cereus]
MNLQKVEMYFDTETGKWTLKHKNYTENFDLETILQNYFGRDEDVELKFTGFKENQDKFKEQSHLEYSHTLRVKGLKVVTSEEAVRHLLLGHKLYDSSLERYVECVNPSAEFGHINVMKDLEGNKIKHEVKDLNKGYISSKHWLVKE